MKLKKETVNIITLGCSKNLVDTEHIMAQLQNSNIEITESGKKCDSVIINTCGFIESAKKESIDTILKAVENKKKGRIKKLYVTGCLSERYKDELSKEIPEVDKFFGETGKRKTLVEILKEFGADYKNNLLGERIITTPSHYAYLKISEGCDNPCSFCAIPLMRGGHKSRSEYEIIKEANFLVSKGVKELIIIGQDTTYWGFDKNGKRELAKLLVSLSKIEGVEWIRLMYAYPSRFPLDLIPVIRDNPKICNYIDIPIQHISDNVLKSMRRGITKKNMIALLEKLRNEIGDIALRTTLLTGYPTETEKDFEELLGFVKEFRFDRLGVFTYSEEDGTFAASLKDSVPSKEKLNRQKILLEEQKKISSENNNKMIGETVKVLIDRKESDYYIGRTYKDAPEIDQEVYVGSKTLLNSGEFYNVEINDYEDFDLFGSYKI